MRRTRTRGRERARLLRGRPIRRKEEEGGSGLAARLGGGRTGQTSLVAFLLVVVLVLSVSCGPFGGKDATTGSTSISTVSSVAQSGQTTTSLTVPADRFPAKLSAVGLTVRADGTGGTLDLVVEIERQQQKNVAVGIREGEVFGTGDRWRAAAWSAAVIAADILNVELTDFAIDYGVSGYVDGSSAGGLMTVATLAAFLVDQLNP